MKRTAASASGDVRDAVRHLVDDDRRAGVQRRAAAAALDRHDLDIVIAVRDERGEHLFDVEALVRVEEH